MPARRSLLIVGPVRQRLRGRVLLHGFDSAAHAQAYLKSEMFQKDVFVGLKPLWDREPEVRIYTVA